MDSSQASPPKEFNCPPLLCTLTIEHTGTGSSAKKIVVKDANLVLGRNEFKDLILKVEVKKLPPQSYPLKDAAIHGKFCKEGKATFVFSSSQKNLLVSNAPPDQLLQFLRSISIKLKVVHTPVSARERLLSSKSRSFSEISPLTAKDVVAAKTGQRASKVLSEQSGNIPRIQSQPVQGLKRKSDDSHQEITSTQAKRSLSRYMNPFQLTEEQKVVLEAVSKKKNLFFTGSAGTGKSFLLRRIVSTLPPDVTFVTASTGIAACHIGGTTLHGFAGIGSGDASLEQCIQLASRKAVAAQWKQCQYLIIDEISMVNGSFFDKLEAVARTVRKNDKPFGGIQLILCGDFLQLPPVNKGEKAKSQTFAFQSASWRNCVHNLFELTTVHRQSDQQFVKILEAIRMGECSEQICQRLKDTAFQTIEKNGLVATKLCTHSDDVDHINQTKLDALPSSAQVFAAIDSNPSMEKTLDQLVLAPKKLTLKVNAQVMLIKNVDLSRGLVNGARGVIMGFREDLPVVRFANGVVEVLKREKFALPSSIGTVTRTQVPLRLAWAFSIHKSQGMTLDCVEMTLSRVFEPGQAYVALSRAKSLDMLRVLDFAPQCVRAHPQALAFHKRLKLNKQQYFAL